MDVVFDINDAVSKAIEFSEVLSIYTIISVWH